MSGVIIPKKYKCYILAIFIVMAGIYLCLTQTDSSFALSSQMDGIHTMDKISTSYRDTIFAMDESHLQEMIRRSSSRMQICRILRTAKTYYENMLVIDKKHTIMHYLQELAIRLCRTDNLSSVFTVIYIHHQDGVKQQGVFVNL